MNDLQHASTLFLVFAAALVLYGVVLLRTGNKGLLPVRAAHSIRGSHDVRRVGRIVAVVGIVVGALALAVRLFARA